MSTIARAAAGSGPQLEALALLQRTRLQILCKDAPDCEQNQMAVIAQSINHVFFDALDLAHPGSPHRGETHAPSSICRLDCRGMDHLGAAFGRRCR
jgi:hypothetical protein